MSTVLRSIEFLSLSIWLGSVVFLSFVVAPGAFTVLPSRDLSGAVVNYALGRLHALGMAAGVVFLLARVVRLKSAPAIFAPAALAVALMLVLTAASQFAVSPRMARLRREMVSIERTPADSPLRAEFNRLHQVSVRLEAGVLLSGLAALVLLVREKPL